MLLVAIDYLLLLADERPAKYPLAALRWHCGMAVDGDARAGARTDNRTDVRVRSQHALHAADCLPEAGIARCQPL